MKWLAEQVFNEYQAGKRGQMSKDKILSAMVEFNRRANMEVEATLPKDVKLLFDTATEITHITREQLISDTRKRHVVYLRNILATIMDGLGYNDGKIGAYLCRDRTTIINIHQNRNVWIEYDNNLNLLNQIKSDFYNRKKDL